MHRAIIVAILVRFALAQSVTLPERLPKAVRELGPSAARGELPCAVEALQPALNFASRFQAGYVVRAPMNAYRGGGHHWDVVFRVTPREGSGQPVLFTDSIDLPDDVSSDAIEEVHGLFLLGEGHYHVKWSMLDDLGRVFRKEWDLEAKATGKERITMPSDTVGDLAWRSAAEAPASAHPQRASRSWLTSRVPPAIPGRRCWRCWSRWSKGCLRLPCGWWCSIPHGSANCSARMASR